MKIKINSSHIHDICKLIKSEYVTITSSNLSASQFDDLTLIQRIDLKVNDVEVIEKGNVIISTKLLNMLPKDTDVTIEDSFITWENGKLEFKSLDEGIEHLPKLNKAFEVDFKSFKHLTECDFAVSKDNVRPVFTCIYAHEDKFISCDGFRLSIRTCDKFNSPGVLIPTQIIKTAKKIKGEKVIKVYQSEKYTQIKIGDYTVTTESVEGEFINYKNLLPNEFITEVTVEVKELLKTLKQFNKAKYVKLSTNDDGLVISSYINGFNTSCTLPYEMFGIDITIFFDPKYVMDALKSYKDEVTLKFSGLNNPMIISEGDKYDLILPMRIKEDL